jgi:phosphoglycolate phosphatase-like HAD superfamily hydrolase
MPHFVKAAVRVSVCHSLSVGLWPVSHPFSVLCSPQPSPACVQGLRKPEPEVFDVICDHLGLEPESLCLIDDRRINVESARQYGMLSVHATSTADIEQGLKAAGVLL